MFFMGVPRCRVVRGHWRHREPTPGRWLANATAHAPAARVARGDAVPADRVVVVVLDDEPVDADRRRADVVRWPCDPAEPLPVLALRDALARWQRGEAPAASLEDCYRAMQLVDDAYRLAEAQVAPRLTT